MGTGSPGFLLVCWILYTLVPLCIYRFRLDCIDFFWPLVLTQCALFS